MSIGHAKKLYEKKHPASKRGNYNRHINKNQDHKSITPTNRVMITSNETLEIKAREAARIINLRIFE